MVTAATRFGDSLTVSDVVFDDRRGSARRLS
jgi:hypothetical protein